MCGQPGSASDGHQGGRATEQRSQAPVAGARDQVTIPLIPGAPRSEIGIVVGAGGLALDCHRQLCSSYSWWSMFNRGGVACGAARTGTIAAAFVSICSPRCSHSTPPVWVAMVACLRLE